MNKKVLYAIMIIAIVVGAIIVAIKGFNYGILYGKHDRLEIVLGADYNREEIENIAKETLDGKVIVRSSTLFKTSAAIDSKEITDEEMKNLFAKLNEKYGKDFSLNAVKKDEILNEMEIDSISDLSDEEMTELIAQIKEKYDLEYTKEEIEASSAQVRLSHVPESSIFDIIKSWISPIIISMAIIMVYYAIRFHKLFKKAWIIAPIKLLCEMCLVQCFILAVIAITRIPVSIYVPTILIFVGTIQLITETVKNEKQLAKIKIENK